eukprot:TRINITY_DN8657_c0_g1_i1.p1 TRINITY_DN8657_c0_g1~~TRINITY_DN8657_c0_g1_i1.p1  ORF type:complete len:248 (+),score=36.79 TRINITY_DN8657_c0_g1_i1:123-866(+)
MCIRDSRWIHMYPTWEQSPVVLWTPKLVQSQGCGIGKETLRDQVLAYAIALGLAMDEVHWDDRLDPYNHTEFLPTLFTFMLDTAPLRICEPVGSENHLTFQPKYKFSCFKIQIGMTLTGQICLYTGLHWGVSPDNHIWKWTTKDHPLQQGELGIADGIYKGEPQLITKFCGNELSLSDEQLHANSIISFYRQRVEHIMHEIKDHAIFHQPFRGSARLLAAIARLVVHATAVELRLHPRYEGMGPWSH